MKISKSSSRSPRARRGKLQSRARHAPFSADLLRPVQDLIRVAETAGGPLLIAAGIAMLWANSYWRDSYEVVWNHVIAVDLGFAAVRAPLRDWVNQALLPVFFFMVGLELKREARVGELASWRRAAMPIAIAIGGMIAPAAVYLLFNAGSGFTHGWGVPIATDIVFAVAVLSLLGNRVPANLRILLLAFATADDVGGILVVLLFYSSGISWVPVGVALAFLAVIVVMRLFHAQTMMGYTLVGLAFVFATLFSGIHTTIAGVVLGLLAPARPFYSRALFREKAEKLLAEYQRRYSMLKDPDNERAEDLEIVLSELDELVIESESPAERLIRIVNPWVSYGVLPIFALANGGVALSMPVAREALTHPVSLGIAAALFFGKPIGVFGAALVARASGLATLPEGVTVKHLLAMSILSGIGFTVAIFIADLAFRDGALPLAKLGVLSASMLASAAGFITLRWATR